jgi:DNA-binding transcriptional LysR family regulator
MAVNLKLLGVFAMVAEHRSFRKAAEELDRSQSVISTQIRQLEGQLGVTLFHRTTRRVTLSGEGEDLLAHVRQALANIEVGVQTTMNAAGIRRGRIVFGCVTTIATTRFASLLLALRERFPDVAIQARELSTSEMLKAIASEDLEFGIAPRVNRVSEFHFESILTDEVLAVVPRTSDLASRAKISLRELGKMPIVMVAESSALRPELEHLVDQQQLVLHSQYETVQVQTMLSLVEAGIGCAVLPRMAIPQDADGTTFRAIPFDPPISRDICVVTLAGKTLSSIAQQFIGVTKHALREKSEPVAIKRAS